MNLNRDNLLSNNHYIGIRFIKLMDSAIIVFGGYSTKTISFECNFISPQKMLKEYEQVMKEQGMDINWENWKVIKKNNF